MGIPIHNQVCTIQNARVVWEVGNVYVVDIKVDETSNTYTRYEIPKSSIIIVSKVFEAK
ncbi:hypothetical protein [Aliarcobacter skirrowii]|uniref:Uncharacterized protein n=1 Tax=Aliarcobacter skirrowii TaxID=28200 RepID=A0AAW9DAP3_9BACT|nr:hypothetical protein [Aliarcobacter skirrowii]MDX4069154.1 hypothetical protein [Aliarcobacter skirrowii]